ncbi:DUF1983 domain-containing protein [Pseudomonas sp. B21-053]|uniref:DUF1983 domain-containing protein n=1 Tax=Pseudomonas sp. B21-053 TaxID=2895493 RepID=UPI00222FE1BD|nr:DUF1983 domain-containing protein [Pseudomonas sp. B21-053]UZE12772.1 DUF1983 domain-containing protein [Pseudomonas sp. B21-053]
MQSQDFVEGVSGWRMSKGRIELYGSPYPIILGKLDTPEPEQPKPFVVIDGVVYISQAEVERGSIANAKISDTWSVRLAADTNGQLYAAGIDIGLGSQFLADRFAVNGRDASDVFREIAGQINETELGKQLQVEIDQLRSSFADKVKEVIRSEMHQGGLLWRST